MRAFITGFTGQLGYDLTRELKKRGITDYKAVGVEHLDITNREATIAAITEYNPDVIFHCAAFTQVDKAEDNKELCNLVNVIGTKNVVDASILVNAKIIYTSTDYVFDGNKKGLYNEEDMPNPMNVYGFTKYLGEEEVRRNPKHFITRISWVFGINGNNFIKTMLKLAENHKELNVVNDQIGSPTYTIDLSRLLVDMAITDKYGTYHATNENFTSWADFARYIFEVNHLDVKVNDVTTEEYLKITNTKQAYRPRNSQMSKDKLDLYGFDRLPSWECAVERYSYELKKVLK